MFAMSRRTAEEDGERFVEKLGGMRIEDVASLQFPRFREEWRGSRSSAAFVVLISGQARSSRRTHHSLPDAEGFWP